MSLLQNSQKLNFYVRTYATSFCVQYFKNPDRKVVEQVFFGKGVELLFLVSPKIVDCDHSYALSCQGA